ncbi:MAG: cbb3-type cytochrome c oxidase subunit II [Luteolibacter sp.]|jgi:cytochrome c oxidase cbb3-type subunit 2|nr:cbb3-type cytochrome c oxidase subunit II [Luteolibacter sp.]
MSLRTFILGLSATFGVAWLAIIVVPYLKMRDLAALPFPEEKATSAGIFIPKRSGRVTDGAKVYAENGCYLCHTQVVRPTYAGNDLYRPDWGGLKNDPDRGDTRRETNAYDFNGETFAQIGLMRMGPDLSNLGRRLEYLLAAGVNSEQWLYSHLYNPRANTELWNSTCPPHPFLFVNREVKGNPSDDALPIDAGPGRELVPDSDAKALISYLLSLKKDHPVPATLNFAPAKKNDEN